VLLCMVSRLHYVDSVQDQLLRATVPATNVNDVIASLASSPDRVGVPVCLPIAGCGSILWTYYTGNLNVNWGIDTLSN
jgi:hypothetical protein